MSKRDPLPPRSSSINRLVTPGPARPPNLLTPSTADPLVSPTPESTPPRYVPYTPRQRQPTTNAMTPTSSPHAHREAMGASEKVQALKTAAHGLGVEAGSIGWTMLERLVGLDVEGDGEEWSDIWSVLGAGKATLLLPLDPVTSPDRTIAITPEFVKDHVVLCDLPTGGGAGAAVTLSGLRGILHSDSSSQWTPATRITFRSSIHPTTPSFQHILDPNTRSSALGKLPPLPVLPHPHSDPPEIPTKKHLYPYPTHPLLGHTHALSLPARPVPPPTPAAPTHNAVKPPLPPRPGAAPTQNASSLAPPGGSGASSKLSGFASLFGVKSPNIPLHPPPPPPPPPHVPASPLPPPAAPPQTPVPAPAPAHVDASESDSTGHTTAVADIQIQAYTISAPIIRDEVGQGIGRGVRGEVRDAFSACQTEGDGVGWVAHQVIDFLAGFGPLVEAPIGAGVALASVKGRTKGRRAGQEGDAVGVEKAGVGGGGGKYAVNMYTGTMEEMSEQFQAFYERIEGDLKARAHDGTVFADAEDIKDTDTNKDSTEQGGDKAEGAGETERQGRERIEEEAENRIRIVMELIEKLVCELLYDRLYLQPRSDDPTHDEALSSRVAALNMLDLGLEHLDVDISSSNGEEVGRVVRACGETLSQLDVSCRSPADKASILVKAHKVVVDGLSKLPPIKFKSDSPLSPDQKTRKKTLPPVLADEKKVELARSPSFPSTISPTDPHTNISLASPISDIVSDLHLPSVNAPSAPPAIGDTISLAPSPISPTFHPPAAATPVSGDILLPFIIFSVVKANPPHLVSHLLYIQRFRNQRSGGEESYCTINLMAVAEFLENVDLGALGLGDSEKKVISTADLTPIPIVRTPDSPAFPQLPSLRGRVEQQVDAIAGSANKVISGVVDTSFGMLRSFLPLPGSGTPQPQADTISNQPQHHEVSSTNSTPWNVRPGFGMLRRESGFSIASLAASLPGSRDRGKGVLGNGEEAGQQLVSVSRPGSVKSGIMGEDDEETSDSEEGRTEDEPGEDDGDEEDDDDEVDAGGGGGHDTRSIKSFESMMSGSAKERREAHARKSLSDRLAHMSGLSRLSHPDTHRGSPPASRRSSLLPPASTNRLDTPSSSRPQSPANLRLPPPNRRFVECHEDDLKVSEVSELLREYKRLVEGVRAVGGFDE